MPYKLMPTFPTTCLSKVYFSLWFSNYSRILNWTSKDVDRPCGDTPCGRPQRLCVVGV